jgi:hypothetical protein
MADLQLVLAICKKRPGDARHWILMLAEEGAEQATWYHLEGGPTQGRPYELDIKVKRFRSHGVDKHYPIARIAAKDKNKVKAAAQNTPLKFCQRWVVDVLYTLELKGLVPQGTYQTWYHAMEVDPYSDNGAPRPRGESSRTQAVAGGRATTTTSSSSSAAARAPAASSSSRAPAASSSSSQVKWEWDAKYQRYKYWDGRQWVYQQK